MQTNNERVDELADLLDAEAKAAKLVALAPIEYDRVRKDEAKSLGIRVATLDAEVNKARGDTDEKSALEQLITEVEPWPNRVDGGQLLDELATAISRYVVLPKGAAEAISLWSLFTYVIDAFLIVPYLIIVSPTKGCGKTTCMKALKRLVYRPLIASCISGASIYRVIELWRPTLLIDEYDSFAKENEDIRNVINSGHDKESAYTIKCDGDSNMPTKFATWTPKAIAGIDKPQETVLDRGILIQLQKKKLSESVEAFRADRPPEELMALSRQCQRWANDNLERLKTLDPELPAGIHNRLADNWRPLFAVADLCGWRDHALAALQHLMPAEDDSLRILLLQDVQTRFKELEKMGDNRLSSRELVEWLVSLGDRPWATYRKGYPINQNWLAYTLRQFQVRSKDIRIHGASPVKGYERAQLQEAFDRYIPAGPVSDPRAATPLQTSNGGGLSPIQSATEPHCVALQGATEPDVAARSATDTADVAGREALKPLSDKECSGVADQTAQKDIPVERF